MSTNIDPKFALAIANGIKKAIDTKAARPEVAPGVYNGMSVELTVEVDSMRVAPDTDKAPTATIPLLTTVALLLKRFNPNEQEKAIGILEEVMKEAVELSKEDNKNLLVTSGVAELETRLKQEVISKMPRTPVKGAVSIKEEDVTVTIKSMSIKDVEED